MIYNIAICLRQSGEYKKAEELLKSVLDNCSRSGFQVWQEIGILKRMCAAIYGDMEKYDVSITMIQELIREAIANQDAALLMELVNLLGSVLESMHTENKTDYMAEYKRAIYLCDLYQKIAKSRHHQAYYKENVDVSEMWYE